MFFDNSGAPVRKNYNLDEFSVSAIDGIGAAFKQSLQETFTAATWRDSELIRANIGEGEVKYGAYSPSLGYDRPMTGTEKKLSTDEAQAQIDESGLPLHVPEEGFTQSALDIVMERKREELVRRKQMDDATGFFTTGAKFGASMVAQVLDPVNVAASFVPVIGPARYAKWVASATTAGGRAAVRGGVGAVEGLAGAALVEPTVYLAMTREQSDYTMADSLINVGLGTVLGGGLHMGLGAATDAIKRGRSPSTAEPKGKTAEAVDRASPETREAMLKTSMAMEAQGYKLDVDAVAASDVNLNSVARSMETESSPIASAARDIEARVGEITEKLDLAKARLVEKQIEMTPSKQTETHTFTDRDGKKVGSTDAPAINKTSPSEMTLPEVKAEISMLDGIARARAEKVGKPFESDSSNYMTQTSQEAQRMQDLKQNLMQRADEERGMARDRNMARREIRRLEKELKDVQATMPSHVNEGQALENSVREGYDPRNKRGVDRDAAAEVDRKMADSEQDLDANLDELEQIFAEYETMTGTKTDLTSYNEAITNAETDAKALQAAVMCRITK